jgi:ribonuclease J
VDLTIHRGAHQIGGICIEVVEGDTRIVIDAGLPLDERAEPSSGNAPMLPGVPGLFEANSPPPAAVLLTHSHLDHYGLLPFVRKGVPVYASEGTKRLIALTGSLTPNAPADTSSFVTVESERSVRIGALTATPYLVDHSAFGALAWLIEANGKRIMYTGDLRAHGRKRALFDMMLRKDPRDLDALLLEGTNLAAPNKRWCSELAIKKELQGKFQSTEGLAVVFASGQNIDRIVSIFKAARKSKRVFVIDVYVAHVLRELALLATIPQAEWDGVGVFYPYGLSKRWADQGHKDRLYAFSKQRISREELRRNPSGHVLLARASMVPDLRRLNRTGASAIWSMWSGYLQEESTRRLRDFLAGAGLPLAPIHTSGHAAPADLKRLVEALRPKRVIPIHTGRPDQYGGLFSNTVVLPDGQTLRP